MRWRAGDKSALDALMPLVYAELRRLAHHYLRQERPDHTLQSTASDQRAERTLRGLNAEEQPQAVDLDSHPRPTCKHCRRAWKPCVVALDDALKNLAMLDSQQSQVVELKF